MVNKHSLVLADFDSFVDRVSPVVNRVQLSTNQKADQIMSLQMVQAAGEKWRSLRTTFTPIFTSGKMKAMMVFINETTMRLITAMDKIAENKESFEAKNTLGKFSMDTIASCAFGLDANVHENEKSVFVQYATEIFKQKLSARIKFMVGALPLGKYILRALNLSVSSKVETEFFYEVVMKTLKQRRETQIRRNDLIDMMMDAIRGDIVDEANEMDQFEKDAKLKTDSSYYKPNTLLEIDIVATAIVILVAGYDTTGSLLSFACYELAKNPDIQARLRQEAEEVLNGIEDELKYEDLQKMTYLDQVLSETLRLHTPLPLVVRVAVKDYNLPGTDITISKGTEVWVNAAGIHSDPKYYPEPDKFDPDRFDKEAIANRHP